MIISAGISSGPTEPEEELKRYERIRDGKGEAKRDGKMQMEKMIKKWNGGGKRGKNYRKN